jgi:hypothetical protein
VIAVIEQIEATAEAAEPEKVKSFSLMNMHYYIESIA